MITKKDYLKAKRLVKDYESSNGIKPVVSKSLFLADSKHKMSSKKRLKNEGMTQTQSRLFNKKIHDLWIEVEPAVSMNRVPSRKIHIGFHNWFKQNKDKFKDPMWDVYSIVKNFYQRDYVPHWISTAKNNVC